MFLFQLYIGSPGEELASPGEYNTINDPTAETHPKISFENFQPTSASNQISQKISYESIPSDQTPIIQIENQAQNLNGERISKSISNPTIPLSENAGPKRKNGNAINGNGHGQMSPNRYSKCHNAVSQNLMKLDM